jgi:hypothetical protein
MSWLCKCGCINGGTNKYCAAARTWQQIEHYQVSENTPDWIMYELLDKEVNKLMTPNEELYAKFYNAEKILVKDMDDSTLRIHIDELAKIAFEAKARVNSASEEQRERKAKSSHLKDWTVSPEHPDVTVSDAINAVKLRKERMSKADRLRQQLKDAGIDNETVNEMMRNLEQRATSELKTVTFKQKTEDIGAIQVKPAEEKEKPKPFDPSTLGF